MSEYSRGGEREARGDARPTADHLRLVMGLKLRSLRQARGWSLSELAERSGMSISYLSEIEKGKKYPKPEKVLRLAEALGVAFDELVSLRVDEALGPLEALIGSPFFREFPFERFGVEPEGLFGLMADEPEKGAALVRAVAEVGRSYDVQVEHFLLAALRSYQQMNRNHFEDLEREAEAFRDGRGLTAGRPVDPGELRAVLEADYGYVIDEEELSRRPELASFRSVFRAGEPPRLWINGRLLPSQRAFVLAREIGYRHLGLSERAVTSSWLEIESFDQLLNNFRASYFAGAVLLDRESLGGRLGELFESPRWDPAALLDCMQGYGATPEMFFYRLTELVGPLFGLDELFFVRFTHPAGSGRYHLSKLFNLSGVPVPYGMGLAEHYCRRWPGVAALRKLTGRQHGGAEETPVVVAQRSHFLDEDAQFLVLSMARTLALDPGMHSSVSIGFRVNDAFRRAVRFWDDEEIPDAEVNLTCERCRLTPEECGDRVAEPLIYRRQQDHHRRKAALAELLEQGEASRGPGA